MKMSRADRRVLLLVLALLAVLSLGALPALAAGPQVNIMPPPPAQPLGKSYSEWQAAWWQWAMTQPTPVNPVTDETGVNCAQGQPVNGPIWFLAGTFGGQVSRTCTVPLGRHIYVPVINAFGAEPVGTDPAVLEADKAAAIESIDNQCGMSLEVDGQAVANLAAYRAATDFFQVKLPEDNPFGAPGGDYTWFADGYGVILTPLSPGPHTVHIYGCFGAPYSGFTDVTYALTVSR